MCRGSRVERNDRNSESSLHNESHHSVLYIEYLPYILRPLSTKRRTNLQSLILGPHETLVRVKSQHPWIFQ